MSHSRAGFTLLVVSLLIWMLAMLLFFAVPIHAAPVASPTTCATCQVDGDNHQTAAQAAERDALDAATLAAPRSADPEQLTVVQMPAASPAPAQPPIVQMGADGQLPGQGPDSAGVVDVAPPAAQDAGASLGQRHTYAAAVLVDTGISVAHQSWEVGILRFLPPGPWRIAGMVASAVLRIHMFNRHATHVSAGVSSAVQGGVDLWNVVQVMGRP